MVSRHDGLCRATTSMIRGELADKGEYCLFSPLTAAALYTAPS